MHQDDADQQHEILLSLEACMACLQILAAPNMPKQVYKEELIDKLVGVVRFQLLHNVLVFYDAALCQAHRPELLNPGECNITSRFDSNCTCLVQLQRANNLKQITLHLC